MPKVEFLFDFGSPNAYLSHLVIPASVDPSGESECQHAFHVFRPVLA